jgi:peptidoglycan/LPS O-acetylase OafA/YrhL
MHMHSAATPAPPRLHLRHVEGMRALAALVVLFNHGYAQVFAHLPERPGPFSLFRYFMVLGHLAVSVFIVISGFCLMLPVVRAGGELRGGARVFFQRRARRILPPYYSAVALSLLLMWLFIGKPTGTLWDVSIDMTGTDVVSHLLLVQDLFGTGRINYAFWSIATEWQIYFLFPLIIAMWWRWGPKVTVPAALLAGYGIMFAFAETRVARTQAHFLGLFTLGMLAAAIVHSQEPAWQRLRERFPWALLGAAAGLSTAGLTLGWGWRAARGHFELLDGLVALVALSLLVLTSRTETSHWRRFFGWTPLAVVGAFSYSLYLIHAPLLQMVWQYGLRPAALAPDEQFLAIVLLGMPAIILLSYLFHRACERPFMTAPARAEAEVKTVLAPSP